jgi:hypothetical protein
MAQEAEKDHEVQMARSDLYKAAKYSVAIHKMMKDVSEMQGIEGWVASKITKAADYLGSVKHYMEGEMMADVELAVVPVAGDMTDAMDVPQEEVEEVHIDEQQLDEDGNKKQVQDVEEGMTKAEFEKEYPGQGATYDKIKKELEDKMDESKEETIEEDAMGDMQLQNLINKISGANKPMKKQPTQTDMIAKIIKNLPRDKEEMGVDAMPTTMSPKPVQPKAPKIPMQQKQKMVNKMARDPYGADMTTNRPDGRLMQSKFENWGKK